MPVAYIPYWTVVNPGFQYPSFILMCFYIYIYIYIYIYRLIIDPIEHHICPSPVLYACLKHSSVVNPGLQYKNIILFYVNMPVPVPCALAWLYLFNQGCPCLGSSTLDILMIPNMGRINYDCCADVHWFDKFNYRFYVNNFLL